MIVLAVVLMVVLIVVLVGWWYVGKALLWAAIGFCVPVGLVFLMALA